jgi:hypothetical protein
MLSLSVNPGAETMKLFQHSGNCHHDKVLKAAAHPSISLVVFLLAIIFILPSHAFAEVRKEYYPNGKLKFERNYINGKQEGITKVYFESGKLEAERNYKNGKLEGLEKEYYESGELKRSLTLYTNISIGPI